MNMRISPTLRILPLTPQLAIKDSDSISDHAESKRDNQEVKTTPRTGTYYQ